MWHESRQFAIGDSKIANSQISLGPQPHIPETCGPLFYKLCTVYYQFRLIWSYEVSRVQSYQVAYLQICAIHAFFLVRNLIRLRVYILFPYAIYARAGRRITYIAYVCYIRPCLYSIHTSYTPGLKERTYAVYAQPSYKGPWNGFHAIIFTPA